MKYIFRGNIIFEYDVKRREVIQHKVNDTIAGFDYCKFIPEDYQLLSIFFNTVYKHITINNLYELVLKTPDVNDQNYKEVLIKLRDCEFTNLPTFLIEMKTKLLKRIPFTESEEFKTKELVKQYIKNFKEKVLYLEQVELKDIICS